MSTMNAIDLSQLAPPAVVETLDFEVILAALKADLMSRAPELTAVLDLESEPLVKLLEVVAYRETLLRARVNDAARACMMAYANGADLDQLGGNFSVTRLVITPADPDATPPTVEVMEDDETFRQRIILSLEGYTSAGSIGAYLFHALSASGDVKTAAVTSLTPGTVNVAVLSRTGTGAAPAGTLAAVESALGADEVRPLCDTVVVTSATIVEYAITAALTLYHGTGSAEVTAAAQAAAAAYAAAQHRLGRDVTRSGLFAALHQPGVQNVSLTAPAADLVIDWDEAPWCTAITLTVGGFDE